MNEIRTHYCQLLNSKDNKVVHYIYDPKYQTNWFSSKWHREDGPAVIYDDGREEWWDNDICYETPKEMPLSVFLKYLKWMKLKHGN